jgi:hypothetical protein
MKNLLFFIPVIAILALAGCSQPEVGGRSSILLHDKQGRITYTSNGDINALDVSNYDAKDSFLSGSVGYIGTASTSIIATATPLYNGVTVKAANTNSGIVYVGNIGVTAGTATSTDGFELGAGESMTIRINDLNKIYLRGSAAGQKVFWLGL